MRALIVMAKAPLAGLAKTRLAGTLGAQRAAELAEAFLVDTLAHAARVRDVELIVAYTPRAERAWFRSHAPRARLAAQVPGHLGRRMKSVFAQAFAAGARSAVLVGSDTPQLRVEALERAFERLERADGVVGPSADGGYYLLGLRERCDTLFEGVDWGRERVLAQTLARARAARVELERLPMEFDLDSPSDLARLAGRLADRGARMCPATGERLRSALGA